MERLIGNTSAVITVEARLTALEAGAMTAEGVRDTIAAALRQSGGVSIDIDDSANTITVSGLSAEDVRDTVGSTLVPGVGVTIAVNDGSDTVTISATGAATTGAIDRSIVAEIAREQALNAIQESARTATVNTITADTVFGGVSYDAADAYPEQGTGQIISHPGGILKQVRLLFGGLGTGSIDIIRPSTGAILQSFAVTVTGAGITTVAIPGSYVLPPDAIVAYRRTTGSSLRYAGGTGTYYYYDNTDTTDGFVTLTPNSGILLSIEFTVTVPQPTPGLTTVSTVYGGLSPDSFNGATGEAFAPIVGHGGGALLKIRLAVGASGTGKIDIVSPDGIILQSFDVTAAGAGVVTLTSFGGYVLPADAIVAYRAISGAPIRALSGPGSIYYYANTDASDNSVTLAVTTNTQIALEFTVAVIPTGGAYPAAVLDGSTWNGLISYGQSLSSGILSGSAISTTQPYSNLTFGSGVRSSKPGNGHSAANTSPGTTTTKALIEDNTTAAEGGAAGETLCSGAANYAVTLAAVYQGTIPSNFVIFGSTPGRGGYTLSELTKGSAWYPQLTEHISEMTARAIAAGKKAKVIAIPWLQGENDSYSGTSRAAYLLGLREFADAVNTDTKQITGQSDDLHLLTYQTATSYGVPRAQLSAIQLAQLDATVQHPRIHLVGPIYHLMAGSADSIHLAALGQLRFGRYVGRAFYQLSVERRDPDCIRILSAVAKGTALTIRFDVPTAPLVIDAFIPVATNNGFKVLDGTGTLTLSSIAVGSDGTSVTMTLNRSLGTNPVVRYALDFIGAGISIYDGASGNLRDSTPDSFISGGTTYPLYHVCPHFEQPIVVLENA